MRKAWLLIPAAIVCTAVVAATAPVAAGGNVNCSGSLSGPVNGNVSVNSACAISNAQISGNVEIAGSSGPVTICDTTIAGNLEIHNNSGPVTLDDSCGGDVFVGGNTNIHDNSGGVSFAQTHVGKNLVCQGDSPAASQGSGNSVAGNTSGSECATSSSTHCTAGASCSVSADDGNTSVTVTADGSGKNGSLTVTLTPSPPSDGGCGTEGQAPFSGDDVTVNAPGGYGTGNPVEVDITYEQDPGFLFVVCKSNDGGKTWFPLPECTFSDDEATPDNVPCAETFGNEEGPSSATVYMTSNDPEFVGHS